MHTIGLVGLDTSHAAAYAEVLAERDQLALHGVWDDDAGRDWDDNASRDVDSIESFCEQFGAVSYDSLDALVAAVDAVMILSVDWERHASLAATSLNASVPTMVDKPVVGSMQDLEHIRSSAGATPLFGGSALPYHGAIEALPRGGTNRSIFAAGYNDFFYYRVHLTDTVRHLADADWRRVEPSAHPGTTVDVTFENGVRATLRFDGNPHEGTFSFLDVADDTTVVQLGDDEGTLEEMYTNYIDRFQGVITGQRDESARLFDASSLLLAVELAIESGEEITSRSDALESVAIGSSSFVAEYEPYY